MADILEHDNLLDNTSPQGSWAERLAIGALVNATWGYGDDSLNDKIPIIWPNDAQVPPTSENTRGRPKPWIGVSISHVETTQQEIGGGKNQFRVVGGITASINVPLKQRDVQALRYAETFAQIFRNTKRIPTNYPSTEPATGQIVFRPPVVATGGFQADKLADGLAGVDVGSYWGAHVDIPFVRDEVL